MSVQSKLPSDLAFLCKSAEILKQEFQSIPNGYYTDMPPELEGKFESALNFGNASKNRYANILPYDSTRVILPSEYLDENDYINANWCLKGRIIISQGPLKVGQKGYEGHHRDFYHMLFTNRCSAIAMVTGYVEGSRDKCSRYLPEDGESKIIGKYLVSVISNESVQNPLLKEAGIQISMINIKMSKSFGQGIEQKITHYHLPTWADNKGANAKVVALLARTMLKEERPLVHCSAGIGRSGTLVAVMAAYEAIKDGNRDENLVVKVVTSLRTERHGAVQARDQYETIYESLKVMIEEDMVARESSPKE